MQKYTIVTFLNKIDTGDQFSSSEGPLHTSLTDNFTIDLKNSELVDKLAELMSKQSSFTVTAGDYFYQIFRVSF